MKPLNKLQSAVKSLLLRTSHFWMLRKVDKYLATEVLGSLIAPIFKGQVAQDELFLNCLALDDGGPQVVTKRRQLTTNLHCVTFQKIEDLIYTAAEA